MTMDKKRYENAIRRFRRYYKKGWPIEKILNEETYKRVIGKTNKTTEGERHDNSKSN